jgi:hypothetical protein
MAGEYIWIRRFFRLCPAQQGFISNRKMMRWVCVCINRRIWGLAKQGRMNRESYHDRHDDDDDDNHYENSTGQKK